MSAPVRDRDLAAAYAPPDAPVGPGGSGPAETPPGGPNSALDAGAVEPTEVRLVGVDAQVVSPAWELELLVTGIVLVGLFQIPPWLQAVWHHWEPHLSIPAAVAGHTFVQAIIAALYALVICFTVALGLRGYWVALVGVNSVFPHGVRWDKQREYGRIQTEIMRPRVRPLPSFIGRVNEAASLVYATGFLVAAMIIVSLGFAAIVVVAFAVVAAVLPLNAALVVFGVFVAALVLPVLGAAGVDMRMGEKLAPGGRAERLVRGALRLNGSLTPDAVRSLGAVLTSNVSKRVAYTALALGFGGAYAITFVAMGDGGADGAFPGLSNYRYFAEGRRGGVATPDFYESLRGEDASLGLPSIQSDVVTDPYVRLFVPYRPPNHNPAIHRLCPTLQAPNSDAAAPGSSAGDDPVLACVARLHAVALDGRPVAARFRFFTNPRTERRGFLMLIPAANLAAGEHTITLQPARRDPTPADTAQIRIPFWR